jgi:hypothetical protein
MRNASDKSCRENNKYVRSIYVFENRAVYKGKLEKYCTFGQATDYNMAHAHYMLDTSGYKHTLRIRNTYCFPTEKMGA